MRGTVNQKQSRINWTTLGLVLASTITPVPTGFLEVPDVKNTETELAIEAPISENVGQQQTLKNLRILQAELAKQSQKEKTLDDPVFAETLMRRAPMLAGGEADDISAVYESFLKAHVITTPEAHAKALADPSTLVVPVRNEETGATEMTAVKFAEFEELKEFFLNINDEHIREMITPAERATELISLKNSDIKAYMTRCIIHMHHEVKGFRQWFWKQVDKCNPLFNADGTFNREFLPAKGWDVTEIKGAGEVPYPLEHESKLPVAMDFCFFKKIKEAAPVDRRVNGAEYDIQSNSRFGMILKWVQIMVERYWHMVRPCDKDQAYYFSLEEEKPFGGVEMEISATDVSQHNASYAVSPFVAKILCNASDSMTPERYFPRTEALRIMSSLPILQTTAAGGTDIHAKKTVSTSKA